MEDVTTAIPMMDENVGTGDGECGKGMLWIGSPVVGGGGVEPTDESTTGYDDDAPAVVGAVAGREGVGRISDMIGPEAGSARMPPYPGMP
jgi:hypothetical protein